MLNKNEILQGLKNNEFLVRNAVYEYICNLHLYDDEDINEALIEYIQNNYKIINYTGLINSKLNVKIIECLIDIYLKEKELRFRERIEDVLIEHYSIIKDLDYHFEEIMTNEYDLLLYKKIKHFSKKNLEDLIVKYINSIDNYYDSDEDDRTTYIQETLIKAMGTALIQSKKGLEMLTGSCIALYDKYLKEESNFMENEMTWLVYPLCQAKIKDYFLIIMNLYMTNMNYQEYLDNCNYYFSAICDDEFLNYYINILKQIPKKELKDYYYDIAEYINSKEIDEFLLKTLKTNVSQEIKENIIRVLACKFEKRVIPFAIQYVQIGEFFDEESLKMALSPMLIINRCEDSTSKEIIKNAKNVIFDEELFKEKLTKNIIKGLQDFIYKDNEQIKKYKKTRKMFEKIVQDMIDYFEDGRFKWKIDYDETKYGKNGIKDIYTSFDNTTQEGIQALANTVIFKNACNMDCITEEFISKNKYKKEEKIEMLQSMLNSEAGLFEITNTNLTEGKVTLKNVLNSNEYEVTDLALSSNLNYEKIYMYTRIITYKDISFCSGLNIPYFKEDDFINKWIKEKKNANNEEQELTRFLELYNEYQDNDHGIQSVSRHL